MPNYPSPIGRVNRLYEQTLQLIEQEIKHIAALAIVEKLSSYVAKDLVAYTKLLGDMKEAHAAIVEAKAEKRRQKKKAVSTEELERVVKGGA